MAQTATYGGAGIDCINNQPSATNAVGAIGMWNLWVQSHPSGTAADLKVDAEAFRKLPPFMSIGNFEDLLEVSTG